MLVAHSDLNLILERERRSEGSCGQVSLTIGPMTTSPQDRSDAMRRAVAAVRLAMVPAIIVVLHLVTRFTPWLLVIIGIAAAFLLTSRSLIGLGSLARLHRADRLALWMVLVCLAVIGYLHDANTWSSDGKGFVRPGNVAMWKTELILGIALAVPLLNALARMLSPRRAATSGQEFAREFALYINFSGIALVLWSGEAVLSRAMVVTLVAWVALAELTLYASE